MRLTGKSKRSKKASFKTTPETLDELDQLADDLDSELYNKITRSDVIRAAVTLIDDTDRDTLKTKIQEVKTR